MTENRPDPTPTLTREAIVQAPSSAGPHRTVLLAIGGMALASLLVPMFIVAGQRHTTTVITVENRTVPAPEAVTSVATVPAEAIASPSSERIPASDDALGTAWHRGAALTADSSWLGVAASPGPYGVLATWSERELYISRDDGVNFRQVLGGPGAIGGATIDASGALYLVRDQRRLGIETETGAVLWRSLPFAGDTLALTSGGGFLGWLGLAHDTGRSSSVVLAVSADRGQTWRTQTVAEHIDRALMHIEEDGTIQLLTLVEHASAPTMRRLRGHADGRSLQALPWPTDFADAWGLGHGGWAYAIASECATDISDVCAMGPEMSDRLAPTGLKTSWDLLMHTSGEHTLAVSGERLLRADGDRMAVVASDIPAGISALATDGIGRALVTVGPQLVRWSPRHGWRVLHRLEK